MPTLSLLMLLQDDALAAALIARLRSDKLLKDIMLLSDMSAGGLDPAAQQLPDVLILDLEMLTPQGADGLAILHKIRSLYPEIRVITLFPAEEPAIKNEAAKLGAFYSLAKARESDPQAEESGASLIDLDELVLAIRRAARARIEDAMVAVAYAESGDFETVDAVMASSLPAPARVEAAGAVVRVLVAGEDQPVLARLARKLAPRRVAVQAISRCEGVLAALNSPNLGTVEVVVLNAAGNPGQCLETLRQIKQHHPAVAVILLAEAHEADALSECTSLGAFDCLLHPVDVEHLVERLEDASSHRGTPAEPTGTTAPIQATPSQESAEDPRALGDHTVAM
ncbi:response regulator [Megalodesulfovibrio paquesii]